MRNENFGWALEQLKAGREVYRFDWNGPGQSQSLKLHIPDAYSSRITQSFICVRTVQGNVVPWLPSQTDLLAEDWF